MFLLLLLLRIPPGLVGHLSAARFAFMPATALAMPYLDPLVAERQAEFPCKRQVGFAPVCEKGARSGTFM